MEFKNMFYEESRIFCGALQLHSKKQSKRKRTSVEKDCFTQQIYVKVIASWDAIIIICHNLSRYYIFIKIIIALTIVNNTYHIVYAPATPQHTQRIVFCSLPWNVHYSCFFLFHRLNSLLTYLHIVNSLLLLLITHRWSKQNELQHYT